jgi:hypothetical protein
MLTIRQKIEEWFTYHSPDETQDRQFQAIRFAAKRLAEAIVDNTPESADQTAALRKLRECVMTANAAIACKGV